MPESRLQPATPHQPPKQSFALSCVLDDIPEIWRSFIPWLASATLLWEVRPEFIHVHHVCELPSWVKSLCKRAGVNLHRIDAFSAKTPYTNKIRQCGTDFGAVDTVILTDVDLAFANRPPVDEIKGLVAGKTVDLPNPPFDILKDIFAAFSVEPGQTVDGDYVERGKVVRFQTYRGNFNGGFYAIPNGVCRELAAPWDDWARRLIASPHLPEPWQRNTDQIAFCLAINEGKMPICILDKRWNYPTHLVDTGLSDAPFAIHHHAQLDSEWNVLLTGDPKADSAIARVNQAVQQFRSSLLTGIVLPTEHSHSPLERLRRAWGKAT